MGCRRLQTKTSDTAAPVPRISQAGSRWEGIRRLKEAAMAFNFLAGVHPATSLQLLFLWWPVIPPGTATASGDKLDFLLLSIWLIFHSVASINIPLVTRVKWYPKYKYPKIINSRQQWKLSAEGGVWQKDGWFFKLREKRWLKLALKAYFISTVSPLNEQRLCQTYENSMSLTEKCAPTTTPPTQPTLLRKVVWNIRESCGRLRSTHMLDFLTRWHCVRQTDVNSWKRDTCVRFMCCLLDDVWDYLKRF